MIKPCGCDRRREWINRKVWPGLGDAIARGLSYLGVQATRSSVTRANRINPERMLLTCAEGPVRSARGRPIRRMSLPGSPMIPILPFALYGASGGSNVITAVSCGSSDVQSAVNQAVNGDTVIIPAGTCTWTTPVTTDKRLILQGAGVGQTVILDGVNKSEATPQMFVWTIPDGGPARMTGIEWRGTGTGFAGQGHMILNGNNSQLRIDHNKFVPNATDAIRIFGYLRGVIDHNTFDASAGFYHSLQILHNNWGWDPTDIYGDVSWSTPVLYGTEHALYVEDNLFLNDQTTSWSYPYAHDGFAGQRVVFRRNTFRNSIWGNHGLESAGRNRSARSFEFYDNLFELNNPTPQPDFPYPAAFGSRGGTGFVYNNTVTLTNGASLGTFGDVAVMRSYDTSQRTYPPWNNPAHSYPDCDGTAVWDGNQGPEPGYPCMDQTGRGSGNRVSGDTPTPAAWPQQILEPMFHWHNTIGGVDSTFNLLPPVVVAGRDVMTSGSGLFSARPDPATATPGSAYWATDQQILYICSATHVWVMSYQPYPYPHPLVTGTGPSPVSMTVTSPVQPGANLTASIHNWDGNLNDYVGVYEDFDPTPVFPPPYGYQYVTATVIPTEGTATLPAPTTPAVYQAKLRDTIDPTVNSLVITKFTVNVSTPQITAIAPISPRSTIFITVTNYTPGPGDWLGLFLPTDVSVYPPPLGTVPGAASTSLLAPAAVGNYEVRLFQGAGPGQLLATSPVTVSLNSTTTMTCTTPVFPGDPVIVLTEDWDVLQTAAYIGVFLPTGPNIDPPPFGKVFPTPTGNPNEGTATLPVTPGPGTYELRFSTGDPHVIKTITTLVVLPQSAKGMRFSRFELWHER